MCWEVFTCPERGPQISFTNLLHSLLFRPYDEHLLMGEKQRGCSNGEVLGRTLYPLSWRSVELGVFHSWHWSLRCSHQLSSQRQHFKCITVAPGGETGCVLQGISACHEKCSLGIRNELNGLMSLPWAWLRKWLFSKKIRSEYCGMGCFLYLPPWIIDQKAFSNSEQHK